MFLGHHILLKSYSFEIQLIFIFKIFFKTTERNYQKADCIKLTNSSSLMLPRKTLVRSIHVSYMIVLL